MLYWVSTICIENFEVYGKFDRCILLYGHALYVLSDVEIDIGVFFFFFFFLNYFPEVYFLLLFESYLLSIYIFITHVNEVPWVYLRDGSG